MRFTPTRAGADSSNNRDKKKKTTWAQLFMMGWQPLSRSDNSGATPEPHIPDAGPIPVSTSRAPAPRRRGFLTGRAGSYPRFKARPASRIQIRVAPITSSSATSATTCSTDSAQTVYIHEAVMPAVSVPLAATAGISPESIGKGEETDATQKLYKCLKLPLEFNPLSEYLSNTTKKRTSTPNTVNSALHFASVLTLVIAQVVLLGTWFAALAPRTRVTRAFFQEIHLPVYQEDTQKREALVAKWQSQVRTYSSLYATGLAGYVSLMAMFAGSTIAWFCTRRPQDPWWGWLNWLHAWHEARAWAVGVLGGRSAENAAAAPGRTPIGTLRSPHQRA